MAIFRFAILAMPFLAGIVLASPLEAQTSASLNVTVRVVQECTVKSKRELVKLARQLNDPSLIRRCSKGVVSRVNQRVVKIAQIRRNASVTPNFRNINLSKQHQARPNPNGQTDVVLVTVTY